MKRRGRQLEIPVLRNRGFTLLELLVVIAIFGVVAGMVTLSATPSEDRLIAVEIDRLGALFRIAQSEARVGGRPLSWTADKYGYRFYINDVSQSEKPDNPLRRRGWPFPVEHVDGPTLVFGLEPLLPPAKIRIATSRREIVLLVDAFGTVTRVQ